ncbi:MAG: hypothetical protein QNJ19_08735 [Woeseiaceae bacterium]|nr:hypothetical protein [Woeseiaceae bacterium]
MNNSADTSATLPTSSLTLRVYESLPGNPMKIGIGLAILLLLIYWTGRVLFDGAGNSSFEDVFVAVTQLLVLAYCVSAYAYLLKSVRETVSALSPAAPDETAWQAASELIGRHSGWLLVIFGLVNYLVIGVFVTNITTPDPVNPWDWRSWTYDLYWHRITTVFFVGYMACFCYVLVVDSLRLSRLSETISSIDLLNLKPLHPLTRQGLTNALLVIGMVSVLSLFAVEARYWPALVGFWLSFILLAWIGMMLPLRGIRKQIKAAREQELDWCEKRLRASRDTLKSGDGGTSSIAEVAAYRTTIESIRNWPFDHLTLTRFALYLLIPLGSWLGGAFVERGLDLVLQ